MTENEPIRTIKILHLEDREEDSALLEAVLAKSNVRFEINLVSNKNDYLRELTQSDYDLIIADFNVPGFKDLESYDLMKSLKIEKPYIIFSSSIGEERAVEAMRSGVNDYVMKNNYAKIEQVILNVLKTHRYQLKQSIFQALDEKLFKLILDEENRSIHKYLGFVDKIIRKIEPEFSMDVSIISGEKTIVLYNTKLSNYQDLDEMTVFDFTGSDIQQDVVQILFSVNKKSCDQNLDRLNFFKKIKNQILISVQKIQLIEADKQREKDMLTMQSQLMTTQMNPHFIFNVMNSVQYCILNNELESSLQFVSSFSRIVRKVLEASLREFITMDEEMAWLKEYVDIESTRLNKQLKVTFNNRLEDEDIGIPPMLLQPFIENSIKHGISPILNDIDAEIILNIEENNGRIQIEIIDNGVGIENSIEYNLKEKAGHNSLGTKITKSRFHILSQIYDTQFNVKMEKYRPGKKFPGTKATVTLPKFEI